MMHDGQLAERRQMRLERLQSTLNRAYRNVPFHRNRQNQVAAETGSDPSMLEKPEDIRRLPFMDRGHLGEHYPYGLFAVPLRDIVRIHTAPGTSLHPTVTGYTRQDLQIWQDMVGKALSAAGIGSRDILQIYLDAGLANWGRDYKDGAESLSVAVIPNTPLSIEKHLMVLRDYRTTVLVSTPSNASQLAEAMFHNGVNPTSLALKCLVLTGEPVDPDFRADIEARFHAASWVHLGMSEVPGPAMAYECRVHQGLHVQEDHFLVEIVDPVTGGETSEGDPGELVLTTLTTRAFPLIRFRTGERVRLLPESCPCGCPTMRIEWLEPRTDDLLNVNGVKVHPESIGNHLERFLGFPPLIRHRVRKAPGDRHVLEVRMAVGKELFSDEIKVLENRVNRCRAFLEENLGVPVVVTLQEPSGLD
jgi:phenylacetate-CoA ligase